MRVVVADAEMGRESDGRPTTDQRNGPAPHWNPLVTTTFDSFRISLTEDPSFLKNFLEMPSYKSNAIQPILLCQLLRVLAPSTTAMRGLDRSVRISYNLQMQPLCPRTDSMRKDSFSTENGRIVHTSEDI